MITSTSADYRKIVGASIWLFVLILLIYIELAGPYLLLTALSLVVYYGTSTGRHRKKTDLSAYSVFNPNCVRLEGTLTAEQFEREILHKPL